MLEGWADRGERDKGKKWENCKSIIKNTFKKPTMTYHLIPVRMAIINKTSKNKC